MFGPALANHSTHRLINCGYTGGSDILAPGDDFTFDMTVHVEPTSDLVFTNFAFTSVSNEDPDAAALGSAFASGNDIIDEMGSQIGSVGNVGVSAFPVPISTPNTSVVPAPRAGGNLSNTGSQPGVLLWFSTLFIGSGLLISRKFRKSSHLLK